MQEIPTPPSVVPITNSTGEDWYIISKKNKIKGILWLTMPIIGLMLVLVSWAVLKFFALQTVSDSYTFIRILNIFLSLLGLVSVVCLIVGIPLGIIYLAKKELNPNVQYDERSGKGGISEIPPEIKGWSWGAAFLSWIWGAYHNVWIAFLNFVPIINYVWWIYMGINGKKLAWQNNKWPSVEYFIKKQKKWDVWGIIIFVLGLLPLLIAFTLLPFLFRLQKTTSNYFGEVPVETSLITTLENDNLNSQTNWYTGEIKSDWILHLYFSVNKESNILVAYYYYNDDKANTTFLDGKLLPGNRFRLSGNGQYSATAYFDGFIVNDDLIEGGWIDSEDQVQQGMYLTRDGSNPKVPDDEYTGIVEFANWHGVHDTEKANTQLSIIPMLSNLISFQLFATLNGDAIHYGTVEGIALVENNTATYTADDGTVFKFTLEDNGQIHLETNDYSYNAGQGVVYDTDYKR